MALQIWNQDKLIILNAYKPPASKGRTNKGWTKEELDDKREGLIMVMRDIIVKAQALLRLRKRSARESSRVDKITQIFKKWSGVKLTPTKIPGLVEDLSEAEGDVKVLEEDFGTHNDYSVPRARGNDTATSDEETEALTEEEEAPRPPPPPPSRRTRGASRLPRKVATRHVTRRRNTRQIAPSDSESISDEESDEDSFEPAERRTRQAGAGEGWSRSNTSPVVDDFTGNPGLKIPKPTSALAYIQLFITRALLEFFTVETNLYASQLFRMANENVSDIWTPVKVSEMARFLGLFILMGIIRLPTMRMYWQTAKPWHARFFSLFMPSRRFQHINQFFHTFNTNAVPVNNRDKLIKVRPVMDYLKERFAQVYIPKKELCLDEGTMAWRGRLSFKVYNPNKPDKYGVKLYMLAESVSGYIYDFDVYSGIGKTIVDTVTGLMQPLVNQGYHLYMDNYYNSVTLTETLRELGVYTCGTIRMLRGAPKVLQALAKGKLPLDTTVYRRKDNTFILLWKDKRVVSIITNIHNADTQRVHNLSCSEGESEY
ncbi:piggyBac transposable element-derived protein 4-like [Procambarus clarkii]|uniref:piggyBac transposable element-derived protein 4-like n=1 Tax=Procambarus clarkii TaxID=6728 RepID=UPI003741FF6B